MLAGNTEVACPVLIQSVMVAGASQCNHLMNAFLPAKVALPPIFSKISS